MIRLVYVLAAFCTLAYPGSRVHAQASSGMDPNRIQMSRQELVALRDQYEATLASDDYPAEVRENAESQLQVVRRRLEEGDFQVGDQIELSVRGEGDLTSTFSVQSGRVITLPEVGEVPLTGVLRSELETHLTTVLGKYLREPDVQARALFRIMISGAVGQPGFYVVPAQALVSEAIMQAGGFATGADLEKLRLSRGSAEVLSGPELQRAIAEGRTFDQLNVRAGDHLEVPAEGTGGILATLQPAFLLVSSIVSLLVLFR